MFKGLLLQRTKLHKERWSKVKNGAGNVSLLALGTLLFLSIVGLAVYNTTQNDVRTAYNTYWKSKSNTLVDFAIEEYRERINDLIINSNEYFIDEIDLSMLDKEPFFIEEDGVLKAKVEFGGVEIDEDEDFDTGYGYLDDLTGQPFESYGKAFYKNVPTDSNFTEKDYEQVVSQEAGHVSVSSIFNEAYNTNEFFIANMEFNEEKEFSGIKLNHYFPLLEEYPDTPPLLHISKEDLSNIANPLREDLFDDLDIHDDISISAVWDENLNSSYIILSITAKEDDSVYVFTMAPIVDSNLTFFDEINFSAYGDIEIRKGEVEMIFDENLNAPLAAVLIMMRDEATNEQRLSAYPVNLPSDTSIDSSRNVVLDLGGVLRHVSSSLFWNPITNSSDLMVFSIEDDTTHLPTTHNGVIRTHSLIMGVDDAFTQGESIPLDDVDHVDVQQVHSIGANVFWDEALNDGVIQVMFSSPMRNRVDPQRLFHLETNLLNFSDTEIEEIDLSQYSDYGGELRNIGRISLAGINQGYGEMLALIEKTLLRIERIRLINSEEQSLTITVYEDNREEKIGAITRVIVHPELEVTTVEESNIRYIKSFEVHELTIY